MHGSTNVRKGMPKYANIKKDKEKYETVCKSMQPCNSNVPYLAD